MNRENKIAERIVVSRFQMGVVFNGMRVEVSVPFRVDQRLVYEVTNTLSGIERYFDGVELEIKEWFANFGIKAFMLPSTISEKDHMVFRTISLSAALDNEQEQEFEKFLSRT